MALRHDFVRTDNHTVKIKDNNRERCCYKSVKSAFDKMNLLHFMKTEIINGQPCVVLKPASERPTITQLRYYFDKHLSNQEKDLIRNRLNLNLLC